MNALLISVMLAAAPTLWVKGPTGEKSLDVKALEAMTLTDVHWSDKKGEHTSKGVSLEAVLALVGVDAGKSGPTVKPAEKHASLRAAVVATAADGYVAVFSVAEVMAAFGPTKAVLIWSEEGQPLGADEGPFRLVVPSDSAPARAIRQLVKIEVRPLS